jgi:hypothetical protein
MLLRIGCAIFALFLFTCTAARKISQVGLREPSSVEKSIVFSDLRSKLVMGMEIPKSCPKELKGFSKLAAQRVIFPECPAGLMENFQLAIPLLNLEERSTIEEMMNSKCRSLGTSEFGNSLENILNNYDSTGPIGRRNKVITTVKSMDGEFKLLADLKANLLEVAQVNLPMERWVKSNGEFLLPDQDLELQFRLIMENTCNLREIQIDGIYGSVRGLEEVQPLLQDQNQQLLLAEFLNGLQKIIDKRLQEYFFP